MNTQVVKKKGGTFDLEKDKVSGMGSNDCCQLLLLLLLLYIISLYNYFFVGFLGIIFNTKPNNLNL